MAQDLWTLWGKKAGSQAAHTQSLVCGIMQVTGNAAGCSSAVLGLPLEMSAVNTSGARAAQMQSPCAAAYRAVPAARATI